MNQENIIQSPSAVRPHVVLLGAGASLAAFPEGDVSGRRLPLMNDLVEVVGLEPFIEPISAELDIEKNFEKIYSMLKANPRHRCLVEKIEEKIDSHFSSLKMPKEANKYDFLILSLREKDAIITFNWDPFLFDAYMRNVNVRRIASLPKIYFLHGNVRIGYCRYHPERWGERRGLCPICSNRFEGVPLLYPDKKDYSSPEYIQRSWEEAKYLLREAFVLTIFGYGAPDSDADAVDLLKSAWMERSERRIEYVEIVDIKSSDEDLRSDLYTCWEGFTPTKHLKLIDSIWNSWIMMYPRRSVEGLIPIQFGGEPVETFPLDRSEGSLRRVQRQIFDIAQWEIEDD